MTQYLLAVHDATDHPEIPADVARKTYRAVAELDREMRDAGVWVFAGGLEPASAATVVQEIHGDVVATAGPYLRGREYLSGFWVIEAAHRDAALAWARRATVACRTPVEVRPLRDEPVA